jgi:hypothetical protein
MKILFPFTLLGTLLTLGVADAAATTPVGYYDFDGYRGGNVFVPGFVNPASYTGQLISASASTLTLAANSLTANAFNEGAAYVKFYAEITSGPLQGVVLDIVSNTANVLTLDADITALGLTGNEKIVVRPHVTLKSCLAAAEASLSPFSDSATLYLPDGSFVTYFFGAGATPNGWSSDFATDDGSEHPVYPGAGFVLGLEADVDLTVTGEVKTADSVVQLSGAVVNIVGPMSPLVGQSVSLNAVGFASLAPFTDSITIYPPGTLLIVPYTYFPLGDGTISSDFVNPTVDTIANTTGAVVITDSDKALRLHSNVTVAP